MTTSVSPALKIWGSLSWYISSSALWSLGMSTPRKPLRCRTGVREVCQLRGFLHAFQPRIEADIVVMLKGVGSMRSFIPPAKLEKWRIQSKSVLSIFRILFSIQPLAPHSILRENPPLVNLSMIFQINSTIFLYKKTQKKYNSES